ncbi:hypothetical protein COEREDRAFT_94699 [Coemansia reversa NRRL 1564]|uniref:Uncharacterized protein n=1 Tax=Coemansia reversa (strain ATCC 12441 / NRRL 1564) TaxID=763665 RepID=A0A2G5B2H6_COERN|nr:hypothetical protein COEREDRAFT_94699 [Coemansia reversa NRRL 1564]|eukprot:PIA13223.1 hypothetical protein COEREDRAFT_94699 [Coemansia reversa NRRL 1564]
MPAQQAMPTRTDDGDDDDGDDGCVSFAFTEDPNNDSSSSAALTCDMSVLSFSGYTGAGS